MPMTDWREWTKLVRSKTPTILEVGKPAPKVVLSFGGAGFLVTYSLGVALYLQTEKKQLVSDSFFLGAGTGCIPALALACGPQHVNLDKIRDFIADNRFMVSNERLRREAFERGIQQFLPKHAHALANGRVALTIGFPNRDRGYNAQPAHHIKFGHHVAHWESAEDLGQCLVAATCPNMDKPATFRGANNVVRGTMMTLSSELDQYCRHVYIHGYAGMRYNANQTRHNHFFGKHSFIANTHFSFPKQALLAFAPSLIGGEARRSELLAAYDAGFHDARRYERWEEDAYYYAKTDRSATDELTWSNMRANLMSPTSAAAERFEL